MDRETYYELLLSFQAWCAERGRDWRSEMRTVLEFRMGCEVEHNLTPEAVARSGTPPRVRRAKGEPKPPPPAGLRYGPGGCLMTEAAYEAWKQKVQRRWVNGRPPRAGDATRTQGKDACVAGFNDVKEVQT